MELTCYGINCQTPISFENFLNFLECGHPQCKSCICQNQIESPVYNLQCHICKKASKVNIMQSQTNLRYTKQIIDSNQYIKYQCKDHKKDLIAYCNLENAYLCPICLKDHYEHGKEYIIAFEEDKVQQAISQHTFLNEQCKKYINAMDHSLQQNRISRLFLSNDLSALFQNIQKMKNLLDEDIKNKDQGDNLVLQKAVQDANNFKSQMQNLEKDLTIYKEQMENLQRERNLQNEEIDRLKRQLFIKENTNLSQTIEELKSKLDQLNKQNSDLTHQLKDITNQKNQALNSYYSLQNFYKIQGGQVLTLQDEIEKKDQKIKILLEAAKLALSAPNPIQQINKQENLLEKKIKEMFLSNPKINFVSLVTSKYKKIKRFTLEDIKKNSKTPIILDEQKYEYVEREYDHGMYEGMIDKDGFLSGIGRFSFKGNHSLFEGQWEKDEECGYGRHVDRNGVQTIGYMHEGQFLLPYTKISFDGKVFIADHPDKN